MRVGVVSDTHGYVDPRLLSLLEGVDAMIHAGDIGSVHVLEALGRLAPVFAVGGNNDVGLPDLSLPERLDLDLAGVSIHVVHQLPDARPGSGTRVVVFGHSHRQLAERRGEILYLNPGAAGRAGFHRLQTAAMLLLDGGRIDVELVELGAREATSSKPGGSRAGHG